MYRIIKEIRPDYFIGENVPGLLSIEGGMVFEQVCLDLESEGYEVQAFVLPACATGAPHRRDRVWIVASNAHSEEAECQQPGISWTRGNGLADEDSRSSQNSGSSGCPDGEYEQQGGFGEFGESGTGSHERDISGEDAGVTTDTASNGHSGNYWANWISISPFHTGYDGLSEELVRHIRTSLSEAGQTPEQIEAYLRKESNWLRKEAIKCAGNAIVPQVVLEVMKSIQNHYEQHGK
jgi:DNA (cytosine-5)-methyltransferase 1